MTVETLVGTEIEPARSLAPVKDADSSLAAVQFEAIIRAWKGEAVEGAVPDSPVGEVDWDGSLGLGPLDPSKLAQVCTSVSFDQYSYYCSPGESRIC